MDREDWQKRIDVGLIPDPDGLLKSMLKDWKKEADELEYEIQDMLNGESM